MSRFFSSTAETWVACNPRPLWLSLPVPLAVSAAAIGVMVGVDHGGARVAAAAALLPAALGIAGVLRLLATPRLACDGQDLLLHLRLGPPLRVPAEAVELIFRGQGPAREGSSKKCSHLVLRLAERRRDLRSRAVQSQLGRWTDGHITLLGAHCEPVTAELIERVNRRLIETRRAIRAAEAKGAGQAEIRNDN